MVVSAKQVGFSISETADVLIFSYTTVPKVTQNSAKKKKKRSINSLGWKYHVDESDQMRMARLF